MADGRNWRKSMGEIRIYVEGGGDEKKYLIAIAYLKKLLILVDN